MTRRSDAQQAESRPKQPKPRSATTVSAAQAAARSSNPYHHGHLREALLQAAVQVIEDKGVDGLHMRELARMVGVSAGAPFRHFPTRKALLTAVAEQATEQLVASVQDQLAQARNGPDSPAEGWQPLAAIGHAYLGWAHSHPTHFRVASDRSLIDYESSAAMQAANDGLRHRMQACIAQAVPVEDPASDAAAARAALTQLASRALVYGLARMAADGHFPEWSLPGKSIPQSQAETLDFFIDLLAGNQQGR